MEHSPNVKAKTRKLLEETQEKNLCKEFLDRMHKA